MKGLVKSITPETVYEGEVYAQNVVVEFDDDVALTLRDDRMVVSEAMVGSEVDLELSATLIDSIEPAEASAEFEVEPYPEEMGPGIARLVSHVAFVDGGRIGIELFDGVLTTDTFESDVRLEPGDAVRCVDVTKLLIDSISARRS